MLCEYVYSGYKKLIQILQLVTYKYSIILLLCKAFSTYSYIYIPYFAAYYLLVNFLHVRWHGFKVYKCTSHAKR